jgi:hypothetical protein
LEVEGKIAAGSYQSVGNKAYQIIRGHAVRPPGNALVHVGHLMHRSERGDANATYEIYLTISECGTFASDRADQLAESAEAVGAGMEFLEKSDRLLQECESLVLRRDVYEADWLTRAAAMGSQDAMVLYAQSPREVFRTLEGAIRDPERVSDWRQNAAGYLNELSSQGNIAALAAIGSAYQYGGVFDPDPVAAYAHMRALQKVNVNFVSDETIRDLEEKLGKGDLLTGIALSEDVYRKCCIR